MSKVVQIRILKDGTIEAVTNGIKGPACTDYIEVLEELLNAKTETSSYTDEFYAVEQLTTEQFTTEEIIDEQRIERK